MTCAASTALPGPITISTAVPMASAANTWVSLAVGAGAGSAGGPVDDADGVSSLTERLLGGASHEVRSNAPGVLTPVCPGSHLRGEEGRPGGRPRSAGVPGVPAVPAGQPVGSGVHRRYGVTS